MVRRKYTHQTYGADARGEMVFAFPVCKRRMSHAVAMRIQRGWERWRRRYLAEHPGDYPTRRDAADASRAVVWLVVERYDEPQRNPVWYRVARPEVSQ